MTRPTETLTLAGHQDLRIEADAFGDPSDPPVLLLHGGGQTRHAWREPAARLGKEGFYVVVPDLRGHGGSDWSPDGDYGVGTHAADLAKLAQSLTQPPSFVGASLGGLATMLASGETPQVPASAVVLVDVAHRPLPQGIDRIVGFMRAHPDGFSSIEQAAEHVAAYLPHRAPPPDTRGLQNNLRLRDGRWRWHWDPRLLDVPELTPKPERLLAASRAIPAPLLVVRGAMSDVIDVEIAEEFCDLVPGAQRVEVAGAAHMVAGDRNDRFLDAVLPTLTLARERAQGLEAARRFLSTTEASAIGHPGGTLLLHLERTAGRLTAWDASPALIRAGLCHAAYGTDGFARSLIAPDESGRARLREAIGREAEAIVYAYAATDRTAGLPYAKHEQGAAIVDRFTRVTLPLGEEVADALSLLTAANELDVLIHSKNPDSNDPASIAAWLEELAPRLPTHAARTVRAVLASHRNES